MEIKTHTLELLLTQNAPIAEVIHVNTYPSAAIQLNYGAGSNTTAKLQASVDYQPLQESGNWVDVSNSSQVLSNAGGSHMWNVTSMEYPWLQIVVDGDAVDCQVWFTACRRR